MTTARLRISVPPSLNGIFFNKPHGGRAKTTAYKAWREATAWEIRAQRPPLFVGDVIVRLVMERPTASSDIDNRIKPTLDVLQAAGVIKNDCRVIDVRALWGNVKGCEIRIRDARKGNA